MNVGQVLVRATVIAAVTAIMRSLYCRLREMV
jgi:hypothetical protein